jgi:16S rRNA (cytosine967-C5)-methyltransferase
MDDRLNKYLARFDRVLVDAPCTGLGTLRRNPDLKWRQNELSLKELVVKQEAILRRAADFVKPGGVLVYATCSILQEENQIQAQHFLAQHPMFEMIPVETILAKQGINGLTSDQPWLQMTPYQNQTDGFFGVVFQKK